MTAFPRQLVLVVAALGVLCQCNPRFTDFFAERSAQTRALQEHLTSIRDAVAMAPPAPPEGMCPPTSLILNSRVRTGNVEIYVAPELPSLAEGSDRPTLQGADLTLEYIGDGEHMLSNVMAWAFHPGPAIVDGRISRDTQRDVDHALRITNMIILRQQSPRDGGAGLDVFLADLTTGRLVCGFSVAARSGLAGFDNEGLRRTVAEALGQRLGLGLSALR